MTPLLRLAALPLLLVLSLPAVRGGGQPEPGDPESKGPPVARTVPKLVKQLGDRDAAVRVAAAHALADFGPRAEPAVPALAKVLDALDDDLQLNAALALAAVGKPAVLALVKALGSEENEARYYAAFALAQIGPAAREAVPALLKALGDYDEDVRRKAADALGAVGGKAEEIVPALVKLFRDPEPDVANAAGEAAGKFGKAAVPFLMKPLEDPKTRYPTLKALSQVGAAARLALPVLRRLQETVREPSCEVVLPPYWEENPRDRSEPDLLDKILGAIFAEDPSELAEELQHRDPERRQRAVRILKEAGPKALPLLQTAARDPSRLVRLTAILGLADYAAADPSALKSLKAALRDPDVVVRERALAGLAALNIDTTALLEEGLKSAKGRERIALAGLLAQEGAEHGAEVLRDELQNKEPDLRHAAACALARENLEGKRVLPVLAEGLKHKDPAVREASAAALRDLDEGIAWPILRKALQDPDRKVRVTALRDRLGKRAIANMDQPALPEMTPALAPFLKDPDASVRRLTLLALESAAQPSMVGPLAQALKDPEPDIRRYAADLLGQNRSDAKAALPALVELARDRAFWADAVGAVRRIDPEGGFPLLLEVLREREPVLRKALDGAGKGKKAGKPAEVASALRKLLRGPEGQADGALSVLREAMSLLPKNALTRQAGDWAQALKEAAAGAGKALAAEDGRARQAAVVRLAGLWGIARALEQRLGKGHGLDLTFLDVLMEAARGSPDARVRYLARRLSRVTPEEDEESHRLIETLGGGQGP